MKKLLRIIFVNAVSLTFVASFFPGFSFDSNVFLLFLAAFVFTAINFYVKPIIKLFLLPVNLLTLGMFRWITGVICLFLLTVIIPEFSIRSFDFEGLNFEGFAVPIVHFSIIFSLIASSFFISMTSSFIYWLLKK